MSHQLYGNNAPRGFFFQFCMLIFALILFAQFLAYLAIQAEVVNAPAYRLIDSALIGIFPGIKHLAVGSNEPAQLRLFLYLMWAFLPAIWVWAFFRIRQRRKVAQEAVEKNSPLIVLAGIAFTGLSIWVFLFRDAPIHISYVSRGGALLWLLRTSAVGQTVFAFVLFFFLALAIPALLQLIFNQFKLNGRK